jgi:hypothetical protein
MRTVHHIDRATVEDLRYGFTPGKLIRSTEITNSHAVLDGDDYVPAGCLLIMSHSHEMS